MPSVLVRLTCQQARKPSRAGVPGAQVLRVQSQGDLGGVGKRTTAAGPPGPSLAPKDHPADLWGPSLLGSGPLLWAEPLGLRWPWWPCFLPGQGVSLPACPPSPGASAGPSWGPSPGPTGGGSWLRLSPKPLALTDPVSQGPGVAAGQHANGGWPGHHLRLTPPATLSPLSAGPVTGPGSVSFWLGDLCCFTSEPPFGKRSSQDPPMPCGAHRDG